ncbi:hypothetical protein GGR57DRAFT_501132 [Xylariaceae sp. FL1272]|nr:hypothetical protein GGR57DRAFT_501132 [Xylariaceae sp. FL1272]
MPEPTPGVDPRDITISTGFGPPFTTGCSYCSQDSPWGASCTFTSLPGCTSETARVTLQAGSSYVHVGTLTSNALYTSVSNALESICPTPTGGNVTSCSRATPTIGGLAWIDSSDQLETDGELVVRVESSSYENAQIRDAMIHTIATAVELSATGVNCYTTYYNILGFKEKRDDRFWWLPSFLRRDTPHESRESITLCNVVGPLYIPPQPTAASFIDANFDFEVPPGGDFFCKLLEDASEAFVFLLPEFAVEEVEAGEALEVACEDGK